MTGASVCCPPLPDVAHHFQETLRRLGIEDSSAFAATHLQRQRGAVHQDFEGAVPVGEALRGHRQAPQAVRQLVDRYDYEWL